MLLLAGRSGYEGRAAGHAYAGKDRRRKELGELIGLEESLLQD